MYELFLACRAVLSRAEVRSAEVQEVLLEPGLTQVSRRYIGGMVQLMVVPVVRFGNVLERLLARWEESH